MTSRARTLQEYRTRYFLVAFYVVLAAAILTAGYVYYQQYDNDYREEVDRQIAAITDLKVKELVNWGL